MCVAFALTLTPTLLFHIFPTPASPTSLPQTDWPQMSQKSRFLPWGRRSWTWGPLCWPTGLWKTAASYSLLLPLLLLLLLTPAAPTPPTSLPLLRFVISPQPEILKLENSFSCHVYISFVRAAKVNRSPHSD